MNAIWTSSFTKINPNIETFESNIRELLRTNGFHLKMHGDQNLFENSSEDCSSTSTSQNHHAEDEIEEVHLQVTSRSVSRLQGKNILEKTTVLKVYSKTQKEDESNDAEINLQKGAPLSGRSKVPEGKMKNKLKNFYGRADKMEASQLPIKETGNAENRIIEDSLSYPELVEIYFSNKDVDSDKELMRMSSTFSKDESKSGDSISISRNVAESVRSTKHAKSALDENRFVEPTRDRQKINPNVDEFEQNRRNSNKESLSKNRGEANTCDSKTSGFKEKVNEKIELDIKETTSETVRKGDSSGEVKDLSLDETGRSNERKCNAESNLNFADSNAFEDLHAKSEKFAIFKSPKVEDFTENCETMQRSDKCDEEKSSTENCNKIENMNFSIFEDTLLRAKESQNICLNSTFTKTDKSDEVVKSNKSEVSKSTLNSDDSSVENITVIPNEEKSSVKSLKENKMKIVIEKRESKKDNSDRDVFDDVQSNLLDKNVRSVVDDKKEIQESEETANTEVADSKDKITQKIKDDYKDMNICKMLTSIHEQLTYDLKRIKGFEAKLQGKVNASSSNHTMPLQLLDKTVARCKSYIHGSNNSEKAEAEIAKVFSSYGVQLMTAVNKNKAALDEQEQRINQMQSETVPGRNINNKRSILKEINSSWNCWKPEIVYLIAMISGLVKNVMEKSEEKENVKDPRKYKPIYRHATNNLFVHDYKLKHKSDRFKPAKPNLFRKESAVETQISVVSNLQQTKSKTSVKLLNNVANREKEKVQSEKKTIDKVKTRKESSKNKNHGSKNQQPIWRPGGIVRIPSSKTNLFAEYPKTEKPTKTAAASKKKATDEFSSIKNILTSMRSTLTSNSHNSKIVGKKSNTSLMTSPRKPRPGILRAMPRICNEPVRQIVKHPNSKFESKSSHDDTKRSKDTKPVYASKMSGKEDGKNVINRQLNDKITRPAPDPPAEANLIREEKEETESSKEEPTRDVDSSRFVKNDRKSNGNQTTEALDLSKKCYVDEEINVNVKKYRSQGNVTDMNCMTDFNSGCKDGFEVSNPCRTASVSLTKTRDSGEKIEKAELDEETQKNASITRKRTNSHALSLSILKEFLCEQGIDADLVNRAERELKEKQRTRRYAKRKSISFADMFFSVRDDQRLQKALKNDRLWDMLERKEERISCGSNLETGRDCEKSLKSTEDSNCGSNLKIGHEDDGEKSLKYTEDGNCGSNLKIGHEDDGVKSLKYTENSNCGTRLRHVENAVDCEKSLKFTECHEENDINGDKKVKCTECHKDIDCEKSLKHTECDKENDINCVKLKFAEYHEENDINCEKKKFADCHEENDINCEKKLKFAEYHEENDINCEKNLKCTECHQKIDINCEKSLKYIQCHVENDINSEKKLKYTKHHEENDIHSEKKLKYTEYNNYHKENDLNYAKSLKYTEHHEENDINYEKKLKFTEHHEENDTNYEKKLKFTECHKENDINYEKKLKFTECHKENINYEKNSTQEDGTACGWSIKNTKNCIADIIDRETNLKYRENFVDHKKNLKHTKSLIGNVDYEKCSREIKGSKVMNCENLKYIEGHEENDINCKKSLKYTECHKENDINSKGSLKYTECHKENINYEKNSKQDIERSIKNTENCIANIDRETNLKYTENFVDHENLKHTKSLKENVICDKCSTEIKGSKVMNCENDLKYIEDHEENDVSEGKLRLVENVVNYEKYLRNSENNKENDVTCTRMYDDNFNCDKSLRFVGRCEENINRKKNSKFVEIYEDDCEASLMHVECQKENRSYENRFPRGHIEIDVSSEKNLRYKEKNSYYESSLQHTGNHEENKSNYGNSTKHTENHKEDSNCKRIEKSSLKHTENYEENSNCKSTLKHTEYYEENSNCKSTLKHTENYEENKNNCKSNIKHTNNHKESDSNCKSNVNRTDSYKEGSINCERDLKQTKDHKETRTNHESSLKNIKNHEENNNYEKDLKYIGNHKDTNIYDYKNLRRNCSDLNSENHKENDCESNLKHLENNKENPRERNLNPTGSHKGNSINCDDRINRIENSNYFDVCLKRAENTSNNNCDTGLEHPENYKEIGIDCESLRHTEYHKESFNYGSGLNYAGNYRESSINCDGSLNYAESYRERSINCDGSYCAKNHEGSSINYAKNHEGSRINYAKNHEGSSINCARSLNYAESNSSLNYVGNHKENNINYDSSLKYSENQKENNINSDTSLNYEETCKRNHINFDSNLRYGEDHEESNNCGNSLKYTENHRENVNYNTLYNSECYKKYNSNYESSLKYTKDREIDINLENSRHADHISCENILKCVKSPNENNLFKNSGDVEPEMKDAASGVEKSNKDVSSQTNFRIKDSRTLQGILQNNAPLKQLRVTETQTEVYRVRNVSEGRNVFSMTEALPVGDNPAETMAVSFVSASATTELDRVFSNSFAEKNFKKESRKLSRSVGTFDEDGSAKKCDNFFRQLLNQMQECSSERNDASNELHFVESNASTSSGSFSEDEKVLRHAYTSPIKTISSETMAAFRVTAIRIRNIYRAIDVYNRKLRNERKAEKRSKRVNKICGPSQVSKSSSVETIFARKSGNEQNGVARVLETLRQAEVEFPDACGNEQEDSESTESSSTTWSYESTCGKVELKISGKLSDTVVFKDVGPLMEFLVQKTEESDRVQKISNNEQTRFQDTETTRFTIFSRENLLALVYGVVCSIVFWCLHFTITCDIVL